MIDLCKLFGVEEGEEFRIVKAKTRYRFYNNSLQVFDTDLEEWRNSSIMFNYVISSDIIKLPKKKQFTDDELVILRNFDTRYKWLVKDRNGELYLFENKPFKDSNMWKIKGICHVMTIFNHLFNSVTWEDEEPVFIDDYVERGAE
jgi:hypothetical protein